MSKKFNQLTADHIQFIESQKIFFVATALDKGTINLSPKGMDTFRVVDHQKVVWLNLTGSGNETAAHLQFNPRITIMFCSFESKPLILRIYGNAKVYHEQDSNWEKYINMFPKILGSRQIIDIEIELIQTSCGYSIPLMEFKSERITLRKWAENKGIDKIKAYQQEKNTISLDGLPTGLPKK